MKIDIFQEMEECWPSKLVARTELRKFTGGLLNAATAANLDCQGIGIPGRLRIGRKVVYPTASVVEYIRQRSVLDSRHLITMKGKRH